MKRIAIKIALGLVVLLVVFLAGVVIFGGVMIKGAVNRLGPMVMGVPVKVEKVLFRPLAGTIRLTNLHVGNPDGFKTPAMFELGEVHVELDAKSLLGDMIIIRKVAVNAPHITYEKALLDSNFGVLLKQLQRGKEKTPEQKAAEGKAQKMGKKVVIDELVVSDPALNVSITAAGGHYIPVKLGRVELKDIGKERGGATLADAIQIIFSVITSNVENAVLGAGDLVGSAGRLIGSGAKTVGGVVESASSVVSGLGGLLGSDKKSDGK